MFQFKSEAGGRFFIGGESQINTLMSFYNSQE
jgi:hypothetical protein